MTDTVVILGMHRSGTSCLTGSLKDYGLKLGSVSEFNKYNQKGNQENPEIFRLNEALLNHNDSAWNNPINKKLNWDKSLEERRDQVLEKYNLLQKPWGIKDPRMLLTYDFWKESLPNHALIGSIRHPKAVALSLAARKNLCVPMESGYRLWKIYNESLIRIYKDKPFPVVNFDSSPSTYKKQVELVAKSLGLDISKENRFFDITLKNQSKFDLNCCPPELLDTYQKLLQLTITG